jgi:hypothetical protein
MFFYVDLQQWAYMFVILLCQPIEMKSPDAVTAIESVQHQTDVSIPDFFVTVITTAETILTKQATAVSIKNTFS